MPKAHPASHDFRRMKGVTVDINSMLKVLDAAIAINPEDAESRIHRAKVLRMLGRRDEALEEVDRYIALAPAGEVGHAERGLILGLLGRSDEALAELDRAVALGSRDASTYQNIFTALTSLGRSEEAEAALLRVLEIDPDYYERGPDGTVPPSASRGRPDAGTLSYPSPKRKDW